MCEFDKLDETFASDLYLIYKRSPSAGENMNKLTRVGRVRTTKISSVLAIFGFPEVCH